MEFMIDKLRIGSLRAQIECSRLYSEALSREFRRTRSGAQKMNIVSEYEQTVRQIHSLQMMLLGTLEKRKRERDHPSTEN